VGDEVRDEVAAKSPKGVEFAGHHNRRTKELRVMLDDHGLVACGTHTPHKSVLDDKLKATICPGCEKSMASNGILR
jgi:hypothetical protein